MLSRRTMVVVGALGAGCAAGPTGTGSAIPSCGRAPSGPWPGRSWRSMPSRLGSSRSRGENTRTRAWPPCVCFPSCSHSEIQPTPGRRSTSWAPGTRWKPSWSGEPDRSRWPLERRSDVGVVIAGLLATRPEPSEPPVRQTVRALQGPGDLRRAGGLGPDPRDGGGAGDRPRHGRRAGGALQEGAAGSWSRRPRPLTVGPLGREDRYFTGENRPCTARTIARTHAPVSGFSQRRSGKREKSPSVEQRVNPYSMANAARWASGTRLGRPAVAGRIEASMCRCRSVGSGVQVTGRSSQSSTCAHARTMGRGSRNTRGFVTNRTKARRLAHGRATPTRPFSRPSSQRRAGSCWGKSATLEYTNRLASTKIT